MGKISIVAGGGDCGNGDYGKTGAERRLILAAIVIQQLRRNTDEGGMIIIIRIAMIIRLL